MVTKKEFEDYRSKQDRLYLKKLSEAAELKNKIEALKISLSLLGKDNVKLKRAVNRLNKELSEQGMAGDHI